MTGVTDILIFGLHYTRGELPIHGKSSSLARPDAHQGVFHERNNFASGLKLPWNLYNPP